MGDDELAKYPGLYQRGGVWYVRKRVPLDLQHLEQREQVRLSLETGDRRTAVQRYPFKLAEIEAGFDKLRREHRERDRVSAALATGKLEALSRTEIDGLASAWWASRVEARRPEVEADEDLQEVVNSIDADLSRIRHPDPGEGDPVQRVADQLLVEAGMVAYPKKVGAIRTRTLSPTVDRSTAQYQYLCELVRRALPLEAVMAKDHVLARRSAPHDAVFNPSGVAAEGASRRLKDLIAEYRAEREALHGRESTDRKYGLLFRVLEEALGPELPVTSIGRAQCLEVLTFLRSLPPNVTKRFPKLTLTAAVEKARATGLPGLAPNTVGSYMQNLSAILRWAEKGDWGVKVNVSGLIESRRPQVQRRRFEPEELRRLFAALEGFRSTEPTKFWVPALALFTGARAGEVCQLRAEDVVEVGDIPCLNLTEFDAEGRRVESKRLKTKSSERYVPLHGELLSAGFLAFVDSMKDQGCLFPDVVPAPGETYSNRFSKWFGRYKTRIGFDEPALVFHSFRHGFRDACRDADIPEETAMALGGWAGINQATRYGDRGRVPNLHRAMAKVRFGDFTLKPAVAADDASSPGRKLPPARPRPRRASQ